MMIMSLKAIMEDNECDIMGTPTVVVVVAVMLLLRKFSFFLFTK
jgi:hypothetical protein